MAHPVRTHISAVPLPVDDERWEAIVRSLGLSPRQAKVTELVVRGLSDKQISAELAITGPTLRTYLNRISVKTRTRGRQELALCVWSASLKLNGGDLPCRQK